MTRLACALALGSLALLLAMLARTDAQTAIPFAFGGHASLAGAIVLALWQLARPSRPSGESQPKAGRRAE